MPAFYGPFFNTCGHSLPRILPKIIRITKNVDQRLSHEDLQPEIVGIYRLAKEILGADEQICILPLFSQINYADQNHTDEFFHGVLIVMLKNDKKLTETDRSKLAFFAHHIGQNMECGDPYRYCPAVNGGEFQRYVEKEVIEKPMLEPRKMLMKFKIARPSAGLRPRTLGKDSASSGESVAKDVDILLDRKTRQEIICMASKKLKELFDAENCFYIKYTPFSQTDEGRLPPLFPPPPYPDNDYGQINEQKMYLLEPIGNIPDPSKLDFYENAVAISAMIGAPYQTATGDSAVIAIPQYVNCEFVGSHVIITNKEDPPLLKSRWKSILDFCRYLFNALYANPTMSSNNKYSYLSPWDGYIDIRPDLPDNESDKGYWPSIEFSLS